MVFRFAAIALASALLTATVALAGKIEVGAPAPAFTIDGLDGQTVSLASFRGKVALVNFWATWCIPCRKEMPDFERAYRENREKGFVVIGVNTLEKPAKAAPFVKKLNITFPIALDPKGKTARAYNVLALPLSVLIDRNGVVAEIHTGLLTREALDAWLNGRL